MAALVDRLGNRFGFEKVRHVVPLDSHLPDRAWRGLRADASLPAGGGWPRTPPRPSRLLPVPEPVEAEAETEEGPPAAFRWRGRRHLVAAAEGPERIAPEWWRDDSAWAAGPRDYWRIEDEAGRRFWLCRTGQPPEWRLHGLFG